ncbi:hypothetical protein ACQUSR_15800 [Streptomyces sp. P1-3]|uniref:hypothetical protein n=1 Tax=Streptomyces sp. P1-3 TaxID=3421658 RepID=UPI003D361A0D
MATAVLVVEAFWTLVVYGFVAMTQESPRPPDGPAVFLPLLPFMACIAYPAGLLFSVAITLPTAVLARWTGPRWWRVPAVVGVSAVAVLPVTAVLCALFRVRGWDIAWLYALLWAGLGTGAQLVRISARRLVAGRKPSLTWRVYAYGGLAMAVCFALGTVARGTGLVDDYRPPQVSRHDLVGTWTDGDGGTLRLAADGTATAGGLAGDDLGDERCDGTGAWTYDRGDGPWGQTVSLDGVGCWSAEEWTVGGTADRLKINYEYDWDPDSTEWYVLTRR